MKSMIRGIALLALLLAAACGGETQQPPLPDANIPDAGPPDTGIPDSGPPAPEIVSFTVSSPEVQIGTSVTLSYEVRTSTSVTLTRESGAGTSLILSGPAFMRTLEVGPLNEPQIFRLQAHGIGRSVEATLSVTVSIPEVTILDFTASPNPAEPGTEVIVRWETQGAEQIRVYDRGAPLVSTRTDVDQGELRLTASDLGTKLVLEASNPWRTRTRTLDLYPRGAAHVFDFAVTPPLFMGARSTSVLSWQVRGETVEIFANDMSLAGVPQDVLTASIAADITEPTLFTLRVTGAQRTATARRIATNNAVREVEPNDGLRQAQALATGVLGSLGRVSDQDFYRLTLAESGHLFLDLWPADGVCPRGVGIRLLNATGGEILERDAGETTQCPRLDPLDDVAVRGLAAGDYFVVVDGTTIGFDYGLVTYLVDGRCGDGLVERPTESCDDGNTADEDGCSSTCGVEITDSFTFPGPDLLKTNELLAGEVDYYEIIVTSSTAIAFATAVPAPGECTADTVMALLDSNYSVVASNDDAIGLCAALDAIMLQPGTYYLRLQAFDPAVAIATYTLTVGGVVAACGDDNIGPGEVCDDGNTMSGDGCSATCTVELLPTPGSIVFDIPPDRIRMVEFQVTDPGQSITATTSDGQGGCGVDTRLILARDTGFLGYVTNGSGCARINPRTNPFAANLEPGTYRLIVVNDGATTGSVTLDFTVNDPACGNRILETLAQEMCDDGNLVDDDGCSSMCQRQLGGTVMGPGGPPVIFAGSIPMAGGHQSYALMLSAPGNLYVEVDTPILGQCFGGDPVVEVYDTSQLLVTWNDDFMGSLCSRIDPVQDPFARLPAGAYVLSIRSFSFQPMTFEVRIEIGEMGCGNLIPEVGEQCDDGNTAAGDGCSETCQFEP